MLFSQVDGEVEAVTVFQPNCGSAHGGSHYLLIRPTKLFARDTKKHSVGEQGAGKFFLAQVWSCLLGIRQ